MELSNSYLQQTESDLAVALTMGTFWDRQWFKQLDRFAHTHVSSHDGHGQHIEQSRPPDILVGGFRVLLPIRSDPRCGVFAYTTDHLQKCTSPQPRPYRRYSRVAWPKQRYHKSGASHVAS